MNSESEVVAELKKAVSGRDDIFFQKMHMRFITGFPDILVACNGDVVFYEVKFFRKSLENSLNNISKIQWHMLNKMHAAKMYAAVLIVKDKNTAWVVEYEDGKVKQIGNFMEKWKINPTEVLLAY
jgi:penicillin-binding protein-related factor A (putative recombinase)